MGLGLILDLVVPELDSAQATLKKYHTIGFYIRFFRKERARRLACRAGIERYIGIYTTSIMPKQLSKSVSVCLRRRW